MTVAEAAKLDLHQACLPRRHTWCEIGVRLEDDRTDQFDGRFGWPNGPPAPARSARQSGTRSCRHSRAGSYGQRRPASAHRSRSARPSYRMGRRRNASRPVVKSPDKWRMKSKILWRRSKAMRNYWQNRCQWRAGAGRKRIGWSRRHYDSRASFRICSISRVVDQSNEWIRIRRSFCFWRPRMQLRPQRSIWIMHPRHGRSM